MFFLREAKLMSAMDFFHSSSKASGYFLTMSSSGAFPLRKPWMEISLDSFLRASFFAFWTQTGAAFTSSSTLHSSFFWIETETSSFFHHPEPSPVLKCLLPSRTHFRCSCLLLLFERGRVEFDRDLIENSEVGLETKANFGERLGGGSFR